MASHPGRYVSPQELDRIEDLMDKIAGGQAIRPSLAQCVAMVMEIRDARGWARLDSAEKAKPPKVETCPRCEKPMRRVPGGLQCDNGQCSFGFVKL